MSELSYEQKRTLLQGALDPNNEYRLWIKDIFADRVVVEENGRLFQYGYSILDGKATLGERTEVMVSYDPFAELKDVEVLRTGTFTSMSGETVTYTEEDLDAIAANSVTLKDTVKPPLVATHDEGDDASVQVFGSVHGGLLHNVRKAGEKLLADIKGMPKKAAELLGEVGEFRLSPEIYKDYKHEGQSYGKALRRVAWVAIPAIKTMAGITAANLFEERPDQPTTWVVFDEGSQSTTKKEKRKMPEDITKLQEDMDKLSEQNKALKAENETAVTRLSEKDAAEKKTKVVEMVKPLRAAGLAPATADRLESFAEGLDNSTVEKFGEKSHTRLDEFSSILDSMLKREKDGTLIVQFGEVAPGSKGEDGKGTAADRLSELTRKKLAENKDLNYAQAFSEVQVENPDIAKEYSEDIQKK